MVLGMSLHAFTVLHVVITLVELGAGLVLVLSMMGGSLSGLSGLFLLTAALTAITGFLFPFHGMTPGIILGILSLIFLAPAVLALYTFKLRGAWRTIFAVCSVVVLYFDAFVAVAQSFGKIPALHALAPTQKEPPFAIAQGLLLLVFLLVGTLATRRFRQFAQAAV